MCACPFFGYTSKGQAQGLPLHVARSDLSDMSDFTEWGNYFQCIAKSRPLLLFSTPRYFGPLYFEVLYTHLLEQNRQQCRHLPEW